MRFSFLHALFSSESLRFGGAAVLVGLASGAGIWLFKWLIETLRHT